MNELPTRVPNWWLKMEIFLLILIWIESNQIVLAVVSVILFNFKATICKIQFSWFADFKGIGKTYWNMFQ